MHPLIWDHLLVAFQELALSQFFGLLNFLQQCGANRACHPLRIKTYILYWPVWLPFSRYTWSVAGTFSSPHPSDTRFHTAVGGVCGRGTLCYPMTCWIPWSNVLRSLGFCEDSFFCVSYEQVYLGFRNTLPLMDCLEIAFTSKGRFCIPSVMGAVSLGIPETISMPSFSELVPVCCMALKTQIHINTLMLARHYVETEAFECSPMVWE